MNKQLLVVGSLIEQHICFLVLYQTLAYDGIQIINIHTTTCLASTGLRLLSSQYSQPPLDATKAVSRFWSIIQHLVMMMRVDAQWPLLKFPKWFVTPYKSYLYGGSCVLGSLGDIGKPPFNWDLSAPAGSGGGMYPVKSKLFIGKSTNVSTLSENLPFASNRFRWIIRTGGNRARDNVLEAGRFVLHWGQSLWLRIS